MTDFKIVIKPGNLSQAFKDKFAGLQQRLFRAIDTAMNMARGMLEQTARADIGSAGNFGQRWTDGLKVTVEGSTPNMKLSMTHDIPYASIFETGGTIHGNPFLWLPISGTDAENTRPANYSGGIFSARYPRTSGPPLLFAISDKLPRYFGVPSVTIPRKFRLREDVQNVLDNMRSVFDTAWKQS